VGIDGTFYGRIWAFRDVTDSKQAERRLATQSAISRAIADSNTSNEAMPKIVQAICESEGWDFGAIWEVNKESNRLRCLETWQRPECPAEEFAARTRALTFASNVGLPGRVWASGKPMLISNVADDNNYPRAPLAIKIGLRSALAFPIVLEGDVIGVMDFLGQEIRATDEKMLEMFLDIGLQIGAFFKRKKLEEQYRQSQKMEGIGQLAGGVAHDFNNILAAIQMQSDLLKSSGGLSDDQSAFADEIGVTVQRAAALTRQLLLFSRREVFQPRDLDLGESIANTIKMLRRILGENVRIQLKIASQPMFIHADAGMMDQILLNLVVNARDAMPNGGQLVIETSGVEFDHCAGSHSAQMRLGSFVCLSVSDSGCGMAPEILPRIFEPFFTTKEIGKGTGLGLATVFGIVQQHQGWIDVYSELDHGTTFRVYLPRLAKNAGSKSSQSPPTAVRGGCETILLAEDDPSLRLYVRKAVSQFGYRVLEAPTGVKALEVWKENRDEIRLLLTDLLMPGGMNGKDLAQQLLQENAKLKVIYMSGYGAEVVGKDFPLKEGDNFLSKPFKALKLAQTIREKLDEKN
jgi:signal transduction histidine kinase/ActR/RegA family two-component response regulator